MTVSPPDATIGYLPQEPERHPDETVRQFLARRTGVAAAGDAMQVAADALAAGMPGADEDHSRALKRWLALGGDLDERVGAVATGLGLSAEYLAEQDVARRHARADYESTRAPARPFRRGPAPSGPGWKRESRTPGATRRVSRFPRSLRTGSRRKPTMRLVVNARIGALTLTNAESRFWAFL